MDEGVFVPAPTGKELRRVLRGLPNELRGESYDHAACLYFDQCHRPAAWKEIDALEDGDPLPTMPEPIVLPFPTDAE